MYTPDKPIKAKNGRTIAVTRERSVEDMIAALDWAMTEDEAGVRNGGSSVRAGDGWSGTDTVEEYRDMLRNGWPEGVADAEGLEGLSTDRAERLTFHREVGGVFPVVPAYLAGAPDAMLDVKPTPVDNVRSVTLVVDSSFNCQVTSETALQYARKVMQLVAWLAAEGIDSAVYIICSVALGSKRCIYVTPVRNAGDVMQPERLASIIHPAWLRRAWFALLEREYSIDDGNAYPEARACRGGYGSSRNASADEVRQAIPHAQSVILLPKVGSGDPQRAVEDALSIKMQPTV